MMTGGYPPPYTNAHAGQGPQYWSAGPALRQSGLGVASFLIAVIIGAGLLAVIVVAGVMEARTPGGIDENSPT